MNINSRKRPLVWMVPALSALSTVKTETGFYVARPATACFGEQKPKTKFAFKVLVGPLLLKVLTRSLLGEGESFILQYL